MLVVYQLVHLENQDCTYKREREANKNNLFYPFRGNSFKCYAMLIEVLCLPELICKNLPTLLLFKRFELLRPYLSGLIVLLFTGCFSYERGRFTAI
jgi:hypothetical protein